MRARAETATAGYGMQKKASKILILKITENNNNSKGNDEGRLQ